MQILKVAPENCLVVEDSIIGLQVFRETLVLTNTFRYDII